MINRLKQHRVGVALRGWLQRRWLRLLIIFAIGAILLLLRPVAPVDASTSAAPLQQSSPLSPLTTTSAITAATLVTGSAIESNAIESNAIESNAIESNAIESNAIESNAINSNAVDSPLIALTTSLVSPATPPITDSVDVAPAAFDLMTLTSYVNRGQTSLVLVGAVMVGLFVVFGLVLWRQR